MTISAPLLDAVATGHSGSSPDSCSACNERRGWQGTTGIRYFAQLIRHESDDEADLTLADVMDFVIAEHQPDANLVCRCCGEQWVSADELTNLGGLRCSAWDDMRAERNAYVIRRIANLRQRWAL